MAASITGDADVNAVGAESNGKSKPGATAEAAASGEITVPAVMGSVILSMAAKEAESATADIVLEVIMTSMIAANMLVMCKA